ncbi:hypothetical protein ACIPC1_19530 [Streptomyces sp. NPDC087263]|uniref:hypothetical protein n=1 Tax=Streptomyces sp. NPDC087263 TaxID=3365773 RepID=UPI0038181B4A
MRPPRRVLRTALLVTTALLLSSCGIPETGVVEAGEPATGIRPVQILHFLSAGDLFAVRRRTVGPIGIETAIELLFRGPDVRERSQGMTTELPSLTGDPRVRTNGGQVSIELPRDIGPMTATAVTQLACTAAEADLDPASGTDTASTSVTITVPDAWSAEGSSETCPSATGAD